MKRPTAYALPTIVVAVLLASNASAQQAHLELREQAVGGTCEFAVVPSQVRVVYLSVAAAAQDFTTVRFDIVPPACSGFTLLSVGASGGLSIQIVDGGYVVSGPCMSAPTIVATVTYLSDAGAPASCCAWGILPWPGSSRNEIEVEFCDGFVGFGESHDVSLNGYCLCDIADYAIGPYRPLPEDGASDVPTNTSLAWDGGCCPNMTVLLSTDPFDGYDPDKVVYQGDRQNPFDPGLLQPSTTYYWRVIEFANFAPEGYDGQSRLWSFTTAAGPVPVETSTWGRVKALYD